MANYRLVPKRKKAQEDYESKIIEFLKKNPNPDDPKVHAFAESLGIDEHKFEEHIYALLTKFVNKGDVPVGRHTDRPDSDFDADELAMGIKIEKEHTDSEAVAKEIAKDHLAEIPNYYTLLVKMEEDAGVEMDV